MAATMGGPITIDKAIPFIISLKYNHTVCCITKTIQIPKGHVKPPRIDKWNFS